MQRITSATASTDLINVEVPVSDQGRAGEQR